VVRTFGTVQSPAVVVVGARIASQVTSISVKDGQMVRAGDLLLSLDDRVVQAQLARDKAILSKDSALVVGAAADMNRAKDLVAKQAGTQQAYDDALAAQQSAQATVDSDKATVDADRLQLEFTKITAPIDGRLGAVQVSVGDLVGGGSSSASGGTPTAGLVTVTQVDPIEVIFHLPESNLQIFKPMLEGGTPPRITALVSGTEKIIASGVLDFIDSSVDTTSGTITMRGVFKNATAALWPGQYVDLEIEQGAIADATVIPTVAIQSGQNGQFVYLVKDDNTVEARPVDVALSDGDQSAINSGLGPGDKVVTEGQQRLKPGAVVTPSVAATPDQAADADPLPQLGAGHANRPGHGQ
jgi:multidrug efflux system membrane fusion protein